MVAITKMLKETDTEETIVFFVTFLSLVAFQLGGPGPPSGFAYACSPTHNSFKISGRPFFIRVPKL